MAEEQKSKGRKVLMGRAFEEYLPEMTVEDRREREEWKKDRDRFKRIEEKLDHVINK